jgi:outer membrane protein
MLEVRAIMRFMYAGTTPCKLMAAFAAAGLLFSLPASAEPKIGVVNVAKLLDESPQARSAMQALQDEFAPRQKEILKQQEDLKGREDKVQRDGDVMGDTEKRNQERELRDAQRELSRKQNEYVEDLNIRRNEELGRLQKALMQEVETFAKAQGYDLILGDGVLYATGAVDVTAQVLQRLEGSKTAPAPAPSSTPPATPPPTPQSH